MYRYELYFTHVVNKYFTALFVWMYKYLFENNVGCG